MLDLEHFPHASPAEQGTHGIFADGFHLYFVRQAGISFVS
jgi:hypothetical protein